MKNKLLSAILLTATLGLQAQFNNNITNWPTPQGGNITSNNLLGYNNTNGYAYSGQTNSSQSWALVDMDGDGKPDLVVTGALQAQGTTQFNVTTSPSWQVYLNNGSGFSGTATTWSTPQGGTIISNNLLGYNATIGVASAGQNTGSQSWSLVDMNGDGKPDLVVTATLAAQGATQPGATNSPNWSVYMNTGSGFSANATTWNTPQGGNITSNNLLGYNAVNGYASNTQTNGSQTWALVDMDGDGKPDLVVTAALQAQGPTENGAAGSPNWQVYLNTGNGFSGTATTWSTPQGGNITSNNLLGYNATAGNGSGLTTGAETWDLVDINGDGKPDLVVTAAQQTQGCTQFNATGTPNWHVYFNTGSGFSGTQTTWLTPQGGNISSNNLLGFNDALGYPAGNQTNGSLAWALVDMDGDKKPELVVTSALQSQGTTQFNATGNPSWQVYKNTGSGFVTNFDIWSTPQGGTITSNNLLGFNFIAGTAANGQTNGSETWEMIDLDGNGKPDLILTAALQAQGPTEYNATTSPQWNVYLNNGSVSGITPNHATVPCTLYPNPNTGQFNLQFADDATRQIEITDITGRTVYNAASATKQMQFNLGTVAPGIYLLRINQNGALQTIKFAVER